MDLSHAIRIEFRKAALLAKFKDTAGLLERALRTKNLVLRGVLLLAWTIDAPPIRAE
jgi:hypothetical protein